MLFLDLFVPDFCRSNRPMPVSKKKVIKSLDSLSEELRELFENPVSDGIRKQHYPDQQRQERTNFRVPRRRKKLPIW